MGEWCRAAGVQVYVCHAPFGEENDLSLLDEDARRRALAVVQESLVHVALVGAECAVIHPSGGSIDPGEREQRWNQMMRSLDSLVKSAQEQGVRLALENMLPQHVGETSDEVLRAIEHFGSPWIGVCFDIGHAHLTSEGVIDTFDALCEHTIAFHLQDNDGNRDRHLQPPYGTIDWASFVRKCRPDDFAFPWSVETTPWGGASWRTMLGEMESLFTEGLLTTTFAGREVHVVCQRCGRYCFGTPARWTCGCDGGGVQGP
jgi:sugar phosphate isomerase/epimerase